MSVPVTVGRVVIVGIDPSRNNGEDVCPAIVTRVWGPDPSNKGIALINVKALNDGPNNEWKTSVILFGTEDAARAHGLANAAYWPPRM